MTLIPGWHPIVVHFPLALVTTAVFLLLAAPESQQYADVLKSELDQLQQKFAIQPLMQNEAIALYRLTAQESNLQR